jgi:hypothetical protein
MENGITEYKSQGKFGQHLVQLSLLAHEEIQAESSDMTYKTT